MPVKTIIEPFRIKTIEAIRRATRSHRAQNCEAQRPRQLPKISTFSEVKRPKLSSDEPVGCSDLGTGFLESSWKAR
jgi:hypothetical protein